MSEIKKYDSEIDGKKLSEIDDELKEYMATDEFEEAIITHNTWWAIAKHFFEFGFKNVNENKA